MQIIHENLSGLEHKLTVTIPADYIADKIKAKLQEYGKKAKIPGFRPGKVPFDILQKHYQDTARSNVLENLIRDTYSEGIKQEKLNPAGMPKIDIVSAKPDEQFVYTAILEVYPEIKLNDFKEIAVEKPVATVGDDDVNVLLEKMRQRYVQWQEINDHARKSQAGDQLTVDFTARALATNQDEKLKSEKDVKFVLGDGSMWVDFEQPLYGVSSGEEKKFILELPPTHIDKGLASKRVEFVVKVLKLCEPILPALDDAFAEKMNIKEGGLDKLKSEIRSHMERELELALQGLFKQAIMDKLLEANPIEVPQILVDDDLKKSEIKWREKFTAYKTEPEKIPEFPRQDFVNQAKKRVSLGLLLAMIIKDNKFTVEPQEIRKKIEDYVSIYYDDKEEAVNKYLSDRNRVSEIMSLLLEEKAINYLKSQINIKEKTISYQDAMAQK